MMELELALAFAAATASRLLQAFTVRSYAAPDEWWQAPEVAHRLVFGIGQVTWEWWPPFEIRSSLHPMLVAAGYRASALLGGGVDSWLVAYTPRLLHAVLAAATDIGTYAVALQLFKSRQVALSVLFAQSLSWIAAFGLLRPFANSLETFLNTIALSLWLRGTLSSGPSRVAFASACLLAGLSIAARATAAFTWLVLGLMLLRDVGPSRRFIRYLISGVPATAVGLLIGLLADSWLYGHWAWSVANFFRVNFLYGFDKLYGVYPWYWYLIDGLPAACGPSLPLIAIGVWKALKGPQRDMLWVILGNVVLLSLTAHKEHRFLLPIAPLLSLFAGRGLYELKAYSESGAKKKNVDVNPSPKRRLIFPLSAAAFALSSVGLAAYINLVHQRGPVAIAERIATIAVEASKQGLHRRDGINVALSSVMAVHVLGPCHATPWYGMVHQPIEMLQLDCSPPPAVTWARRYLSNISGVTAQTQALSPDSSEVELWQNSPAVLLDKVYGSSPQKPYICDANIGEHNPPVRSSTGLRPDAFTFAINIGGDVRHLPSHFVLWDTDADQLAVQSFLHDNGYALEARFLHSHFSGDVHAAEGTGSGGSAGSHLLLFAHDCWREAYKRAAAV